MLQISCNGPAVFHPARRAAAQFTRTIPIYHKKKWNQLAFANYPQKLTARWISGWTISAATMHAMDDKIIQMTNPPVVTDSFLQFAKNIY